MSVMRRRVAAALTAGLLLLQPVTASADALTDIKVRLAQAQTVVRDLTGRRQGQQVVVEQLRGVAGNFAFELQKVDAELMAAVTRFRQAESALERVEGEIFQLEGEIAAKQEAVQLRADVYGTRLRALYKFTRTSPLEQLLASRSFTDALHRIGMMQAVTRVDNRLLGQLRVEQDELLKAREALAEKKAEAVGLRDELNQQRRELEERRGEQALLVSRAQQDQRFAEGALSEMDRDTNAQGARIVALQAQYQQELEELERQRLEEQRRREEARRAEEQRRAQATVTAQALASATAQARVQQSAQATQTTQAAQTALAVRPGAPSPTPQRGAAATPTRGAEATLTRGAEATPTRGPASTVAPLPGAIKTTGLQPSSYNMVWPVQNPVITTDFGERNFAQNSHTGIDMAQDNRTPVYAVADGKVLEVGLAVPGNERSSYGMRVTIAHDTKLSTLYAHLDVGRYAPTVKPGDSVKRGHTIGFIGMTGITSGPHLHFEVLEIGLPRDPRKYLPR